MVNLGDWMGTHQYKEETIEAYLLFRYDGINATQQAGDNRRVPLPTSSNFLLDEKSYLTAKSLPAAKVAGCLSREADSNWSRDAAAKSSVAWVVPVLTDSAVFTWLVHSNPPRIMWSFRPHPIQPRAPARDGRPWLIPSHDHPQHRR